ncbi:MAG: hypothetical protein HC911_16035 [Chloroflexaceae bacterium]|nr:hypothetical protein [Chloroflexaceae bacterium]
MCRDDRRLRADPPPVSTASPAPPAPQPPAPETLDTRELYRVAIERVGNGSVGGSLALNGRWEAFPITPPHAAPAPPLPLHASGVPLGLLTNGAQWMLVDAPKGETTGFISWYAQLWLDEPPTLRSFCTLPPASLAWLTN